MGGPEDASTYAPLRMYLAKEGVTTGRQFAEHYDHAPAFQKCIAGVCNRATNPGGPGGGPPLSIP